MIDPLPLVLAARPLLDPLPVAGIWPVLLVPLAVLISIAYKAVRVPDRDGRFCVRLYIRHVVVMSLQVVVAIAALYAAVAMLVVWAVPALS